MKENNNIIIQIIMNQFQTPILFTIFNRPDTTLDVFAEIKKQKPKYLFIASDWPRNDKEWEEDIITELRKELLNSIDWDCDVKTLFREKNLGCKYAMSWAITWFFENVEMWIILEDDCVPNQCFFRFCEEMLKYYKDDERVMMISWTNYLSKEINIEESYFFTKFYAVWWWATWKRVWEKYDVNISYYDKLLQTWDLNSVVPNFFLRKHFESIFNLSRFGKMDAWGFQLVFCLLLNSWLWIVPKYNLISNIWIQWTHWNTKTENHYLIKTELDFPLIHPTYMHTLKQYDWVIYSKKYIKQYIKGIPYEYFIKVLKITWIFNILRKIKLIFKK